MDGQRRKRKSQCRLGLASCIFSFIPLFPPFNLFLVIKRRELREEGEENEEEEEVEKEEEESEKRRELREEVEEEEEEEEDEEESVSLTCTDVSTGNSLGLASCLHHYFPPLSLWSEKEGS
ncbi:unnamed protein product [Pleuronectes platessa]|uniref:Uncharacterized protein n=1 Tax=Pleuronectes platessa TaxID=8262 RepID=A0A9N7YGC4_PLEPL|nr:unnamed protein product [Pleuronectes platessa]